MPVGEKGSRDCAKNPPGTASALTAAFAFWRACDQPLPTRVKRESRGFQYSYAEQRLFPGEDDRSPGCLTHHLDHAETNLQLLPGSIGQLVGAAARRLDPGSPQRTRRSERVRRPRVHQESAGPLLLSPVQRPNRRVCVDV